MSGPLDVATRQRSHGRGVMPAIIIALAAVVSAISSLNLTAPSIAADLHADSTQISWIVDAYALSFAALLLLAGAIGDRYGRRRALITGLLVFLGGAALALIVDTPGQLIAVQAVLGAGAALVMPATLSTITSTFPPERRVRAVGTWAGVSGASAMLGLLVAGLLLEAWSWRSIFVFNLCMGLIALVGTLRFVPESADPEAPRLDLSGALLSVVGLGVLVYAIIEAPTTGWGSARTIACLALGVLILASFLAFEARRAKPLLDPRLFRLRGFSAGTVTITLQFLGFFGFVFLIVQYLQLVRGESALVAALAVAPLAVIMMPTARGLAPAAAARVGARPLMVLGLMLIAAGFVVLAQLTAASSYWLLLTGLVLLGAGMGLAMTPATNEITEALPKAKQGVASAMNDLARELGAALGIAVLSSIMLSVYRDHLSLVGAPPTVAEQARSSFTVAIHMGDQVATAAQAAFTDGMSVALLWGAALVTAAAAVVALLRDTRGPKQTQNGRAARASNPEPED